MTHALLVGFGIACVALGSVATWIIRGREIRKEQERTAFFINEANTWKQRAIERLDQVSRWRQMASEQAAQLERLPRRGADGRMAKRS